ncbi:MAG: hypothetical protein P8Y96_07715 [Desulfuromonadales bacterium]
MNLAQEALLRLEANGFARSFIVAR